MHLQPETADNAELLYQFKVPKWAVNVGVYGNYIHNYITQVARFEGDILLMTYINATSQTKAGLVQLTIRYENFPENPDVGGDFPLCVNLVRFRCVCNIRWYFLSKRAA